MRKLYIAITGLLALSGLALFVAKERSVLAEPTQIGRYQTVVEGSRTRLFSVAFRFDTMTGKTWKSHLLGQKAEGWVDVKEKDGETPQETSQIGTYQFSAAYLSDTRGQELAAVTRVDTRTGKTWYIRIEPPHWQWAVIGESKK